MEHGNKPTSEGVGSFQKIEGGAGGSNSVNREDMGQRARLLSLLSVNAPANCRLAAHCHHLGKHLDLQLCGHSL